VQAKLYTLAEDFLQYIEAERGYSPLTVTSYGSDLTQFFTHVQQCAQVGVAEALTLANARSWLVTMHRSGLSPNTIGRRVSALKSFCSYLSDNGNLVHNEMARLRAPARHRPLPTYLTGEEIQSLLSAALNQRVAYNAFRDYAIVAVLVFTGLRRGELLRLEVGDVDLAGMTVRVRHGKGGKSRIVPLVEEVVEALRDWLAFRRTKGHEYLLTTVHGNRVWPSRLQAIWKRILQRSGITRPGVTLHTLRHSMATLLLQSGKADLVAIQHLLGHSRLDTTGIYLHVAPGQLRGAVEAHPLAGAGRSDPASRR